MTADCHSEALQVSNLEQLASWASGSQGYLISTTWWNAWVQYSNYTGPGASAASTLLQLPGGGAARPGPISNADLLPPGRDATQHALPGGAALNGVPSASHEELPLRPNLVEQRDFVVVSEASWKYLLGCYGGGPAVARRVVAEPPPGPSGKSGERWTRVSLYPWKLEVTYKDPESGKRKTAVVYIEPEASLAALKARACAALGASEAEVTLWDHTGGAAVRSLEEPLLGEELPQQVAEADGGSGAAGVAADAAADGTAATDMDVDGPAATSAPAPGAEVASGGESGGGSGSGGYMGRTLRAAGVMDTQKLLLARGEGGKAGKPESGSDSDDACGSDSDAAAAAAKKKAGRKLGAAAAAGSDSERPSAAAAAAAAAIKRASGSGSGGGSAAAAGPVRARGSSGGGAAGAGAGNRFGQRTGFNAWDDNSVMPRDGQLPGLAGLSNLGNTCFMNSSLQCLAHAVPLMAAFLGGAYLQDLNRTNPLGMNGELAEAFGSLMGQLWQGGLSSVTPRAFKSRIGRFAPQFSGYAQHDSQEFLAFLLDGLHEDTNRIKNKPYVEEKDAPGRSDEEVAAEAWANYRARNDSLVVDHFQGLFKSTVDCPQCGFNSVKFDPFMYLSLPLPESRRRVVEVVLVRTDGAELPTRLALELASGASLADLLRATAREAELPVAASADPESHLLAARPLRPNATAAYDEVVLLTDIRMRVADALEAGGGGGYGGGYNLRSSASGADQGFVVYYFPDPAQGPKAEGLAPVIAHFKRPDTRRLSWSSRNGVWAGAPLVLYMPEDRPPYEQEQVVQLAGGQGTTSTRPEYQVEGECPLTAALATVLRPFQRPTAVAEAAPAAEAVAAGAGDAPAAAGPAAEAAAPVAAVATAEEAAAEAPTPMEEDAPQEGPAPAAVAAAILLAGGAADDMRPGTPMLSQQREPAAASAAPSGRRSPVDGAGGDGDDGELMEGLEPPTAAATAAAAPSGRAAVDDDGDAAMPGTPPAGRAAEAAMEEDVAAAPSALPPVLVLGPPEPEEPAGALGPPAPQPFDMWSSQPAADAAAGVPAAAATAADGPALPPGPPFTLKLCNNKGDPAIWGGAYSDDIKKEHQREFLLTFSDAATPPLDGRPAYDPELLDCPAEHPSLREHRSRAASGPQPVSLDACMTTFLQPERLAESDAWYCPRCKAHVCADKKLDLWSAPEVLVVHLKRFCYTRYTRSKLDTRVDFPIHGLDLGPYLMRPPPVPPVYDLFAVSNHYGSLGGGHYTAYAKLPSPPPPPPAAARAAAAVGPAAAVEPSVEAEADMAGEQQPQAAERWYCFDDSHVSPVEAEAVRSPAAYVLFYRRRAEAAADPATPEQLLAQLRERRAAVEAAAAAAQEAAAPAADGVVTAAAADIGSPGSPGSDRHHDQDRAPRSPVHGGGGAAGLSLAAAAAKAAAAPRRRRAGSDDEEEELTVAPRSDAAFSVQRRGDAGLAAAADGDADVGLSDLYGDVDGGMPAGPPSPVPMSVGRAGGGAGGGFDPSDYDDLVAGSFAAGRGGGGGPLAPLAPGSPAPPGSPDPNNNAEALAGLYDDLDELDAAREENPDSGRVSVDGDDDAEDREMQQM